MARCEFTHIGAGQCNEEALEGCRYCSLHTTLDPEKQQKRLYNLLKFKYRTRYEQIGDHEALRSLREEVAIAKMMLEESLNLIQNESEYMARRSELAQQLVTIEKLVSSMLKMETSLGTLISKPTLLKLTSDIVQILITKLQHIEGYELLIDEISAAIVKTINGVQGNIE
jgi:hypothetical protein